MLQSLAATPETRVDCWMRQNYFLRNMRILSKVLT